MYQPQNFLKRLLDAGVVTQDDLEQVPTNELRKLLMPGDSGGFVRNESEGGTMALNGQPGGAFDSVPMAPRPQSGGAFPDQVSRGMDQGQPQQLAPQASMAPQQRQVPIKMAAFGNDGIMSDLGSTTGPAPQLDMSRGAVDTPRGKGYYGKDGAVYVAGPDGYTKIVMGYDRNASMAMNKADLARRKGEQDITQSQASVAHTQEQIRASQVNNPDMIGAGGGAGVGPSGEGALSGVDAGTAGLVKALAEGRMAFPGGMAMRSPRMMQLLNLVSAYDPTFDATDYNARNKTLSGFTAGKQGDAVKAVNQAISHAGTLQESIDKLDNFNGIGTPLNGPVNYLQQAFGDPRQGEFKLNATALAAELRKVFAASGGGSLTELQSWESGLPLNASKEQQTAYLRKGLDLLQGGIGALNDQYTRGMGPRANVMDIISPKAKATLEKLTTGGGNSDPLVVVDPNGVAHRFSSQAGARAFKMAIGQ